MAENNMEPVIDSIFKLRWKLTKEEFDNCEFLDKIQSPEYKVKIGSEESKWVITMWPKGNEESERDNAVIGLICLGHKFYHVRFDFHVKTSDGYWPDNFEALFLRALDEPRDFFMEFDPFEENGESEWTYSFSSTNRIRKKFKDDEITIVATLVIDMEHDGKSIPEHMKLTDEFTKDMRSLSVLEDLYDFTIISDGEHFPCYKTLLALRSEFFRGMFRNDKNKKEMEVTDSSPEIVNTVLDFMAEGILPDDIDSKAKEMIHLADMFLLKGLTHVCIVALVKNLSPENATETLTIVDEHSPNSDQRSKILDFIKKEASKVVKTEHWETFVQNYPKLVTDIVLTPCSHNDSDSD